jgi:dTDP-4-dehydrorhamnose 3,5-epimerase
MPDRFSEGTIKGVVVRELKKYPDKRGWLTELFRKDEMDEEFLPAMTYVSSTNPGITRGPHEHWDQADYFCFIGPSTFKLRLWDNRKDSETFGLMMTMEVGETNPAAVLIPAGVVHGYRNIGAIDGIVINCPNRLYAGAGRKEEVDEIRHENDGESTFKMDD